jgi:predicted nuclease of predicted toxin-antitoxin system
VKLLFDENLSPKLVSRLADLFPDSSHIHQCGLGAAPDAAIWEFAANNHFTIVSKDWDFHDRALLQSNVPKVIWIREGNCSTERVEQLLRPFFPAIKHFDADAASWLLILP